MREWRVGDRVSSIATSYPGVGTIINVRFSDIEVRWPDGSWSRERPQDLIYGGRSEDPVTPLGANIVEPTFNQGWHSAYKWLYKRRFYLALYEMPFSLYLRGRKRINLLSK